MIAPASERPGLLAVRGGLLGRRLTLVPTSEVAFIVPRALRVWVTGNQDRAVAARQDTSWTVPGTGERLDADLLARAGRRAGGRREEEGWRSRSGVNS